MRTKLLLAAAFALLLSACASTGGGMQVSPASVALLAGAAGAKPSAGMIGSLATNPCEIATAAGYTAVYVIAGKAERRLKADQITPDQVQPVIDTAQQALQLLDGACLDKNTVDPIALGFATQRIAQLRKTMEALDAGK